MGRFLDTRGLPYIGIGICDRCSRKFPISDLIMDGNSPGLRVCRADWDTMDPYRLPAHESENISLPFVRPDVPLTGGSTSPVNQIGALVQQNGYYILLQNGAVLLL
jgi:hypothetical protein